MTDMYLRLGYDDYKSLEAQLRDWERIETTHTSVDGFYHKALRLRIGDLCLEIQGPAVMAPLRETGLDIRVGLPGSGGGNGGGGASSQGRGGSGATGTGSSGQGGGGSGRP